MIFRELRRNHFSDECLPKCDGYYGAAAQLKTADRRARQRKLIKHPTLLKPVIERLKNGWTPKQISNRMIHERASLRVCQEAAYRYIHSKEGMARDLWWYLPTRRKAHNSRSPARIIVGTRITAQTRRSGFAKRDMLEKALRPRTGRYNPTVHRTFAGGVTEVDHAGTDRGPDQKAQRLKPRLPGETCGDRPVAQADAPLPESAHQKTTFQSSLPPCVVSSDRTSGIWVNELIFRNLSGRISVGVPSEFRRTLAGRNRRANAKRVHPAGMGQGA